MQQAFDDGQGFNLMADPETLILHAPGTIRDMVVFIQRRASNLGPSASSPTLCQLGPHGPVYLVEGPISNYRVQRLCLVKLVVI